jgi:hypothetical protein
MCFSCLLFWQVLLHNKVLSVVGILADDADPLVSVMKVDSSRFSSLSFFSRDLAALQPPHSCAQKVDKAPLETYADIGGLEKQIQVRFVVCECSCVGTSYRDCPRLQFTHNKHNTTGDQGGGGVAADTS